MANQDHQRKNRLDEICGFKNRSSPFSAFWVAASAEIQPRAVLERRHQPMQHLVLLSRKDSFLGMGSINFSHSIHLEDIWNAQQNDTDTSIINQCFFSHLGSSAVCSHLLHWARSSKPCHWRRLAVGTACQATTEPFSEISNRQASQTAP